MAIVTLTDLEFNQLTAAFGNLSLDALATYLFSETCMAALSKSAIEFEQRSKVLAYLTYRINDPKSTN
jgi:hypothetical protein